MSWVWTEVKYNEFEEIKYILAKETMWSFSIFDGLFNVQTDTSDYQLGVVLSQEKKPVVLFSRKLTDTHKRYTTTEKDLLSIAETFKDLCIILLGNNITVYNDHKIIMHKSTDHDRDSVLHQKLLIK